MGNEPKEPRLVNKVLASPTVAGVAVITARFALQALMELPPVQLTCNIYCKKQKQQKNLVLHGQDCRNLSLKVVPDGFAALTKMLKLRMFLSLFS